MTATIIIENGLFNLLSASNVAILGDEFIAGHNTLSISDARRLIERIDRRTSSAPKGYHSRIRAFRNSVVCAFGPDLATEVGFTH